MNANISKHCFHDKMPFSPMRWHEKQDKREMISIIYRIRTFNGRQIDINKRSAEAKLPRKTLTGELLRNWVLRMTAIRISTFPRMPTMNVIA